MVEPVQDVKQEPEQDLFDPKKFLQERKTRLEKGAPLELAEGPKMKIWDQVEDEEERRGSQSVLENFADDAIGMVEGLYRMWADVVIPAAWDIGTGLEYLDDISVEEVSEGVAESAAIMGKGLVDSVKKWENPMKALHNHPLESLFDVAAAAGVLGTSIKVAGKGAKLAGMPVRVRGSKTIKQIIDLEKKTDASFSVEKLIEQAGSKEAAIEALRKSGAAFDLEKFGEAVAKFPLGTLGTAIDKGTRGLREASPTFNKFMAWTGLSREAAFVHKRNAARRRAAISIKEKSWIKNLKKEQRLTGDEAKVAMFEATGLRGILNKADDIAKLAAEGNPAARALSDLIPIIRAEYDDILKISEGLSKASKAKIKVVAGYYKKDIKMFEEILQQEGFFNPEQFRRAQTRFVIEQLDDLARTDAFSAKLRQSPDKFKALFVKKKLREGAKLPESDTLLRFNRGDAVFNEFFDLLAELKIQPTYTPIAEILRKTDMGMAIERMNQRALSGVKAASPTVGKFEAAEPITLRRLMDAVDEDGLPKFVTQLDELAFKNATATGEFVATVRFLEDIAKHPKARRVFGPNPALRKGEVLYSPDPFARYGLDLTKVEKLVREAMVEAGEKAFTSEGMIRVWPSIKNKIVDIGAESVAEYLKKGMRIYAIPEDMAIAVNRSLAHVSPFMNVVWDKPLGLWKQAVLLYNPGWYLQNLLGNVTLTMMAGIGLFEQTRSGLNVLRNRVTKLLPEELQVGITDELAALQTKFAARHRGTLGNIVMTPVDKIGDLSRWLAGFNNGIERFGRKTAFLASFRRELKAFNKAARKGEVSFKNVEEALKAAKAGSAEAAGLVRKAMETVDEHLFDYFNLHPFERQVMRRIFPFWTWVRNTNILLAKALKRGLDEPVKLFAFQRMSKMGLDLIDDQDFPPWLKGHILLGTSLGNVVKGVAQKFGADVGEGDFIFLNLRRYNPFFGVGTEAVNLASVAPLIKVTYERIAGKNTWTEKPFRTGEMIMTYSGKLLRLDQEKGKFTDEPFLPDLFTHVLNQFPQHNWLNNIMNPFLQDANGNLFQPRPIRDIMGNPKFPRDEFFSISQAIGVPLTKVSDKQIFDMRLRKLKWTEFSINRMKSLMKSRPREEWPFFLSAIKEILSDRKQWLEFK